MTWWRFFFDTFIFERQSPRYRIFTARLMVPCSDKYRVPRPSNDNQEWTIPPWTTPNV